MWRFILLLMALGGLLCACTPEGGEGSEAGYPGEGDNSVTSEVTAGPIPEDLDVRLQRRDTEALPAGALVRFQVISRAKNPSNNYRWLLYDDGRWFMAWHSGDTSGDLQIPFDTELPAEPTRTLPRNVMSEVRQKLSDANLPGQQPYQVDPTVEDGSFYVVTAMVDGREYEVIYEAVYPPLVEYFDMLANTYGQ
jgi:hypothetical protein